MRNMHERLEALSGGLEVWSRPGQGTRLTGRVPIVGEQPAI